MFRFTDLVIFRMTRDCNLNCKYCFMLDKDNYKGELVDFDLFKKIIDKIVHQRVLNKRQDMQLTLVFHGGEPLMIGKERLEQYLEYASTQFKEYRIKYNIGMQSNATLLNEDIAKIMKKYDMSIGLSFDGIAGANKQRTDVKQQVFESKFELLQRYDISYGFIVVVGKHNIDTIEETKRYLRRMPGIRHYKANYAEDFFNYQTEKSIELSGEEFFEKVLKNEIEHFLETGELYEYHSKAILDRAIIDILTNHENEAKVGCGTRFCGAGISMIGVNPDGTSHLCDRYTREFDETFVTNNLDYDFHGIHQIKEAVKYNVVRDKVIRETGCDTCPANYICEGGCMAMYYSKHNQQYGLDKDLVCSLYKNFYSYVVQNLKRILSRLSDIEYTFNSMDDVIEIKNHMVSFLEEEGINLIIENGNDIKIRKRV